MLMFDAHSAKRLAHFTDPKCRQAGCGSPSRELLCRAGHKDTMLEHIKQITVPFPRLAIRTDCMGSIGIHEVLWCLGGTTKQFKTMKMDILLPKVAAGRRRINTPVGLAGVRLMGLCLPRSKTRVP